VNSCRSCHEDPVTGGSAALYRNFFIVANNGPLGMVPVFENSQLVARLFSYERTQRETIPPGTEIVAQRGAPPIFGLGLVERIADVDISANADPGDLDADGISGRENFDTGRVGRFGYKSQEAFLIDFIRGPLFNHLGITTNNIATLTGADGLLVEHQVTLPDGPSTDMDAAPDPEMSNADLLDLLTFIRELAPPAPLPLAGEALRGAQIFESVGCAKCHVPNVVRNGTPVFAFSDFLLHDMGVALADGVRQGVATGSEFRTQPLWGVRHFAPYMHDGSAATLEEAINMHGGEASVVRAAFQSLVANDRAAVIAFLETR
jgi:CxxC motif-containing protein (DUF1111 family)